MALLKSLFLSSLSLLSLSAASEAATLIQGKQFDRFVVIVLENTDRADASKQPFLSSLLSRNDSVSLTNYDAVAHPSQPNYVAMIGGKTFGVTGDGNYNLKDDGSGKQTIVDLLESKGISWKGYMEGYKGQCTTDSRQGAYARKHNPFISFLSIRNKASRCANIVPASTLDADIASDSVPQFVFYTPDMNNDGHDTGIAFADKWLKGFLGPKLSNPGFMSSRTAVLITFDETESFFGRNQVYAIVVGSAVNRAGLGGNADNTYYNHYSILKTVESNWGLDNLGANDVKANAFTLNSGL